MRLLQSRKKEEHELQKVTRPTESFSKEITSCISQTLHNKHNVYLVTDLHLFTRESKDSAKCHKRSNFDQIIKNYASTVNTQDVVIFLGDLVDGEFQNKEQLKDIILSLPGKKILVRGNNDLFDYAFYRSCGFTYVTYEFSMNKIVFSHGPVKPDKQQIMNIHGHLHNFKTYWVPYHNMIDVAYLGGREKPVLLQDVMDSQEAYAKLIKECPEHFNEGFLYNEFDKVLISSGECPFVPDPYRDYDI